MQGFNKYYPPDYDGKKTANQLAGKNHALGKRASKIKQGILTVRFEAPYDITCEKCERNIAQGVRFNAAKKRAGNYFTTPIWSFRMKCPSCSNEIEIHTDPKNTSYVVVEGARKRFESLEQAEENPTKAEPGEDVFADVEQHRAAKSMEQARNDEIREIYRANVRQWEDPFTQSQNLRKAFRTEKKLLEAKEDERREITSRTGLHVPLLDETESDTEVAQSVSFGQNAEVEAKVALEKRLHSSAFADTPIKTNQSHTQTALSKIALLVDKKEDVFSLQPVKRKRQMPANLKERAEIQAQPEVKLSIGLVEYSSEGSP